MPRNATGTYTLPEAPFVAGTVISSASVNDNFSDIGAALTGSLSRAGQGGMTGQFKLVDGSIVSPSLAFNNDLGSGIFRPADHSLAIVVDGVVSATFTPTGITGLSGFTPGMVIDYCVDTTPSSVWLFCYGQAISRITYAALFAAIGTKFGSGDGTTTFNLPDLRGRAVFGNDAMGGVAAGRLTTSFYGSDPTITAHTGGAQSFTITTPNLPAYTPSGTISNGSISISQNANSANSSSTTGGGAFTIPTTAAAVISASQGASSFSGAAQGGTSVAFALINPSMILNKMIFTGS